MNTGVRRLAVLFVAAFAVWLVCAWILGPWVIRQAYDERSLPWINQIISGRDVHPVEFYLNDLARVARAGTLAFVAAGLALALAVRFREPLWRRWQPADTWLREGGSGNLTQLVSWGLVVGLALGAAEATVQIVRQRVFGLPSWETSQELVWMAPLTAAAVFGMIAAVGWGLGRWLPYLRTFRLLTLVLGAMAAYALLRIGVRSVHPWAAYVLAAGVGVQLARAAPRRWLERSGRYATAGALAVASVAVAHHGRQWVSEQRALAALEVPPASAPNVLFIVLDTVRAQNLSTFGYARDTTPRLSRFADEGTAFDLAIAPAPWTLPSHATMFTGQHPGDTGVDWEEPLAPEARTLAEVLQEAGYATAGFVANLYYGTEYFGLNQGFARWEDDPVTVGMLLQSEFFTNRWTKWVFGVLERDKEIVRKSGSDVRASFLDWVDRRPERPFFAFLNYIDAHSPYGPAEAFTGEFSEPGDRYGHVFDNGHRYSDQDLRELTSSYDSAIRYLDDELDRLFAALDARGILDETLIVVTSDHGEEFGEHDPRLMTHGHSLYMQALHVPLILRMPGTVPAGLRIAAPVGLVDLPSTVLDLAGLADERMPGESLRRFWMDGAAAAEAMAVSELTQHKVMKPFFPIAAGPMTSVVSGNLHYIRAGESAEWLYDLAVDPAELDDRLDDDPLDERSRAARESLSSVLQKLASSRLP